MTKKFDFDVWDLYKIGINTKFSFHIYNAVTLNNLENNTICFLNLILLIKILIY